MYSALAAALQGYMNNNEPSRKHHGMSCVYKHHHRDFVYAGLRLQIGRRYSDIKNDYHMYVISNE